MISLLFLLIIDMMKLMLFTFKLAFFGVPLMFKTINFIYKIIHRIFFNILFFILGMFAINDFKK